MLEPGSATIYNFALPAGSCRSTVSTVQSLVRIAVAFLRNRMRESLDRSVPEFSRMPVQRLEYCSNVGPHLLQEFSNYT